MGSVNKVILVGRLGRDPEIKHSDTGKRIGNISVATSEKWTDKNGEKQERTEWHRVVIFNDHLCGIAEKYLGKGSQVFVEGSIQTRKWTTNDGVEKYTTEIVLGDFKGTLTMLGGGNEGSPQVLPPPVIENEMIDDEIPF